MAANLEIINGEASFFAARTPAWHGLGTVVPENITAEEAIELANLDVKPYTIPLVANVGGLEVEVEDKNRIVRDDPQTGLPTPLGVIGKQCVPIPIEEPMSMAEAIAEVSGAVWHTAGVIDGGRRVFATLETPNHVSLSNGDRITDYIMVAMANDGTMAMTVKPTPVRVVCQNTLNIALKDTAGIYRIKHFANYSRKMDEAVMALKQVDTFVQQMRDTAERLISRKMMWVEVQDFFRTFANSQDEDNAKFERLVEYYNSETQSNSIGTAWGVFNTIVEVADFAKPATEKTAIRQLFGTNDVKQRALAMLS